MRDGDKIDTVERQDRCRGEEGEDGRKEARINAFKI